MFKNPFSLRSGLCFLILALLSAVGLTGCTPGRIASLAEKIADFDLPEGYSPELGIEADGRGSPAGAGDRKEPVLTSRRGSLADPGFAPGADDSERDVEPGTVRVARPAVVCGVSV